ncbi:hypothetical protein RHSIM_Rhsim04G0177700 [Rhododendron simsii]|uniref:Uncharacterized protein n=1 Tax=Rhododendron simsii TaxID=118357 RepID=A0A834LRP4_RHOSS|nr:hypothetical protein RHSIM_Rhsim04G0177700 [Rhododendron simsii]
MVVDPKRWVVESGVDLGWTNYWIPRLVAPLLIAPTAATMWLISLPIAKTSNLRVVVHGELILSAGAIGRPQLMPCGPCQRQVVRPLNNRASWLIPCHHFPFSIQFDRSGRQGLIE